MNRETAVADYCRAFTASGLEPLAFARRMRASNRTLCDYVLDCIGCWPCSEPELRALQLVS